jgi:hypothetical protein
VSVPGVKPGIVSRLPFAAAALCFLAAALTTWGHPATIGAAGEWWFLGGVAALALGAVTGR